MVALSSTLIFGVLAGVVLNNQGYDLHRVVQGRTAWASSGAGLAFVLAVLLSFMWGGYTAGRMGGGVGAANGGLVPAMALVGLAAFFGITVGMQNLDTFEFPFGVGTLALDANFTPLGIGVVGGAAVALLMGGIWGGIIGARWHQRLVEESDRGYEAAGPDPFTDLAGRPSRTDIREASGPDQ
ncbi:hypothetical protein BH23ACT12_BH23ACT12_14240 [soil metagenome]